MVSVLKRYVENHIMIQNNLGFLQEKIQELRSALFFNTSNAVLKLPTCVVQALKVDEAGQVWFFVNRPEQYLHEFDRAFPSRLNFFKKGKSFYLQITGKAFIVTDPEELNEVVNVTDDVRFKAMNNLVLIKFKIMHAEFYDRSVPTNTMLQKVKTSFGKWLFGERPVYRPYRLQPSY
jgi:general stress protein 26